MSVTLSLAITTQNFSLLHDFLSSPPRGFRFPSVFYWSSCTETEHVHDPDVTRFIVSYMTTDEIVTILDYLILYETRYIGTIMIMLKFYKKHRKKTLSDGELMVITRLSRLEIENEDYFGELLLVVEDIQQKIMTRKCLMLRYIQDNVAHQKPNLYDHNIAGTLLSYFPQLK